MWGQVGQECQISYFLNENRYSCFVVAYMLTVGSAQLGVLPQEISKKIIEKLTRSGSQFLERKFLKRLAGCMNSYGFQALGPDSVWIRMVCKPWAQVICELIWFLGQNPGHHMKLHGFWAQGLETIWIHTAFGRRASTCECTWFLGQGS